MKFLHCPYSSNRLFSSLFVFPFLVSMGILLNLGAAKFAIGSPIIPGIEPNRSIGKSIGNDALEKARVLKEQGKNMAAIAAYGELLKTNLSPDTQFTAQSELALLYAYQKDYGKSFQMYEQLLQKRPNENNIELQYAEILSWAKRYRASIDLYNKILKANPNDLAAQLGRAEVLSWDGQYDTAIAAYRNVLKTQPNQEKALVGLAQITYWQGDLNQAKDQLVALRQQFPASKVVQLELAKTYYSRQEIKSALVTLEPLLAEQNQDAIVLAKEIRSIQSKTEVSIYNRSSKQNSFVMTETVKVPRSNSNNVISAQVGYGQFTQPGHESLQYYPLRAGVEGTHYPIHWNLSAGVDLFDRLGSKPFVQGKVTAQVSSRFQVGATANYQAYKENVATLENGINVLHVQPYAFWQVTPSTSFYTQYGSGFYSDGNREGQLWAGLKQDIGNFYVAGSVLSWAFAKDPNNGYFAPNDYFSYGGEVGWKGKISPGATCNVAALIGRQSYGGKSRADNGYKVGCDMDLSRSTAIETQYQSSSSALLTGEGRSSKENRLQINLKTRF